MNFDYWSKLRIVYFGFDENFRLTSSFLMAKFRIQPSIEVERANRGKHGFFIFMCVWFRFGRDLIAILKKKTPYWKRNSCVVYTKWYTIHTHTWYINKYGYIEIWYNIPVASSLVFLNLNTHADTNMLVCIQWNWYLFFLYLKQWNDKHDSWQILVKAFCYNNINWFYLVDGQSCIGVCVCVEMKSQK